MAELAVPIFRWTDEFLAWEERQAERYEFVGGVLRLMSGGTANHDLVGMNLGGALWAALRGGPRFVHGSNLSAVRILKDLAGWGGDVPRRVRPLR